MRKLQTADVFAFTRVIKACGIRDELKALVERANKNEENPENVGIEALLMIFEAMSDKKAEALCYEALSGPLEKKADEIKKMEIKALIDELKTLAEENDLGSFFGSVFGISGKN